MWMGVNSDNSIAWIESEKVLNFVGDVVPYIEGAKAGMFFVGGKIAKTHSCCIYDLNEKRKEVASSGVIVNGVPMQTDSKSIAKMDQYATESMMNGLTVVHWQKADGEFHDWPIADFKKMFSEITKYENACFGRQKELLAEINAAEDPTTVDISIGWPSKTITFV